MNPLGLQAQIYTAIAAAALLLSTLAWGYYWRGEAFEARGERDMARALAQRCSDSVDQLKAEGDAAKKRSAKALAEARKRTLTLGASLQRLESALKNPPPNATCDSAWSVIESQR
jgi:hypothetical protein